MDDFVGDAWQRELIYALLDCGDCDWGLAEFGYDPELEVWFLEVGNIYTYNTWAEFVAGVITLVMDESGAVNFIEGFKSEADPPGAIKLSGWPVDEFLDSETYGVHEADVPLSFLPDVIKHNIKEAIEWGFGDYRVEWHVGSVFFEGDECFPTRQEAEEYIKNIYDIFPRVYRVIGPDGPGKVSYWFDRDKVGRLSALLLEARYLTNENVHSDDWAREIVSGNLGLVIRLLEEE